MMNIKDTYLLFHGNLGSLPIYRKAKCYSRMRYPELTTSKLTRGISFFWKTMLDKWKREKYLIRFPQEFTHAFCLMTGDPRLACLIPGILGLKVLESEKNPRLKLEEAEMVMMSAKTCKRAIEEQLKALQTQNEDKVIPIKRMEA